MPRSPAARAAAPALLLLAACGGDGEEQARGRNLAVAELSAAEQAAAYEAALRAGFDVEPTLTLLLAPEHLPRSAGLAGGPAVSPEVVAALRARDIVQGTCAAPPPPEGEVPRCEAEAPGYLVRVSQPFRGPGDTLQLYVDAERYALPGARPAPPFHFETAYQLVPSGAGRWRVAREGRVQSDARTRRQ